MELNKKLIVCFFTERQALLFIAILSGGVGFIVRSVGELALEWEAFSAFGQKINQSVYPIALH